MSTDNASTNKRTGFWKTGKGLLSKIFNAEAEDKRIHKALKKMNTYELGQAIGKGLLNPETGERQKLTDDQRLMAERERLKKTYQNRFVPK